MLPHNPILTFCLSTEEYVSFHLLLQTTNFVPPKNNEKKRMVIIEGCLINFHAFFVRMSIHFCSWPLQLSHGLHLVVNILSSGNLNELWERKPPGWPWCRTVKSYCKKNIYLKEWESSAQIMVYISARKIPQRSSIERTKIMISQGNQRPTKNTPLNLARRENCRQHNPISIQFGISLVGSENIKRESKP